MADKFATCMFIGIISITGVGIIFDSNFATMTGWAYPLLGVIGGIILTLVADVD